MKKALFCLSACLPVAAFMFSCKKDNSVPTKSGQDSTVTTPPDTINGEYFRMRYQDTTILYRAQSQHIEFLKLNSASYMYDLSGGGRNSKDTFDLDLMFGYSLPKDTGTYKIYGEFSLFESYSDSMYIHITKAAQIGQQMEATFENKMQSNSADPNDSAIIKGDFRLTVKEQ